MSTIVCVLAEFAIIELGKWKKEPKKKGELRRESRDSSIVWTPARIQVTFLRKVPEWEFT